MTTALSFALSQAGHLLNSDGFSEPTQATLGWWAKGSTLLQQGQADLHALRRAAAHCRQLRHQMESADSARPSPDTINVPALLQRIAFLEAQLYGST